MCLMIMLPLAHPQKTANDIRPKDKDMASRPQTVDKAAWEDLTIGANCLLSSLGITTLLL